MNRKTIALVVLCFATIAGCSGGADELVMPSPETGGPLVGIESGAPSVDLGDPSSFVEPVGNYVTTMLFEFTAVRADGSQATGTIELDGATQVEPAASRHTFTATGAASVGGDGVFEIATIGEQTYFFAAQMGCVNITNDASQNPFDSMVDTGGMLTGEVQRVLPDETINGVPAYHYRITQDNLDLSDNTAMDVREITNGAIYIARDGGYVVRLLLEGRGVSSLLSGEEELEGDIFYQLDLTPTASVGEITAPEGCAPATEADFPIMPDATSVASFQGFVNYQSPSDLQVVLDFYSLEMPAAGWTLIDESVMANVGLLRFTMDDRTVSVAVSYDANLGMSNVIIGEE
jgi:hypothetical protein